MTLDVALQSKHCLEEGLLEQACASQCALRALHLCSPRATMDDSRHAAASLARPDANQVLSEITNPSDPIFKVISDYKNERIQIVQAADILLELLKTRGLAEELILHPKSVGIHPGNRDQEGVNALAVHILAADILECGWSQEATRHACCIRERPGSRAIHDFTDRICSGTDLPTVDEGVVVAGSIACTHTNMVLRCFACASSSTHADMSENGRYCVRKLAQKDQRYADAVATGLTWTVLDWRVPLWYPAVTDIVQAARNMGQTLNREESEMQTLLRIHRLAADVQQTGPLDAEAWRTIYRAIMRNRPPCQDKVESMVAFVVARSGGVGGEHLRYLTVFFRNCVQPVLRKGVPGGLYESLATFPLHLVALALFETAWTGPKESVRNKQCMFVSGAEVNALAKEPLDSSVVAADSLLSCFRQALQEILGLAAENFPNNVVVWLSTFNGYVGRYLLNKQSETKSFDSLNEIADAFAHKFSADLLSSTTFEELRQKLVFQEAKPVGSDESAAKTKAKAKAKAKQAKKEATDKQSEVLGLYRLDSSGKMVDVLAQLRTRGLDLHSVVIVADHLPEPMPRDEAWIIEDTTDQDVCLMLESDPTLRCRVPLDKFLEAAKPVSTDRVQLHPLWPKARLASAKSVQEAFLKAKIVFAVESLVASVGTSVTDQVYLTVKPSRSVFANKDLAPGELVLLPEAYQVKLAVGDEADELSDKGSAVEVFVQGASGQVRTRIFLIGQSHTEAVAPYWSLEHASAKEEDTNLALLFYKIQVVGGCDPIAEGPEQLAKRCGPTLVSPQVPAPSDETSSIASASKPQGPAPSDGKPPTASVDKPQGPAPSDEPSSTAPADKPTETTKSEAAVDEEAGGEKESPTKRRKLREKTKESPRKAQEADEKAKTSQAITPSVPDEKPKIDPGRLALAQQVQRHDGQGHLFSNFVYIPVYVNSTAVRKDEALRLPAVQHKTKAEVKAVSVTSLVRRARMV